MIVFRNIFCGYTVLTTQTGNKYRVLGDVRVKSRRHTCDCSSILSWVLLYFITYTYEISVVHCAA